MTAPTLSGLAGEIILAENLINSGRSPIASAAVVEDAEGDIAGGVLRVSGLLAEDRVGILHTGTAAGQISLAGDVVSYGGVAIATRSGGAGGDLVVTFTANATTAAAQALVRALTFSNPSDTPTADRTLTIDLTDAAGEALSGGPQAIDLAITADNDAPQAHISRQQVLGPEILVNSATAGAQNAQQIVTLADGNFVVTWVDASAGVGGADGDWSSSAVKAQLFTAVGVPIGQEIRVNSAVEATQSAPKVAALTGGGFIVTWGDTSLGVGGAGGDTTGSAIKARQFAADGSPLGGEFLVNTATAAGQSIPQVTALSNGGFAIVWQDLSLGVGGAGGDVTSFAVKLQVYDASGARVGSETLVNTATESGQLAAQVKALSDGLFFVTWGDLSLGVGGATGDTTSSAVKGQLFGGDGSRIGSEVLINTATQGSQSVPVIAALANGPFVIAWQDLSAGVGGATGDTSSTAVKAQLFDAEGARVDGEFLVNTATASTQTLPKIAALSGGGFAIAWSDSSAGIGGATGDNASTAIKVQRYVANGSRVGGEMLVNTSVAGSQTNVEILALTTGGFVVAWEDSSVGAGPGATGDASGVALKAQVFGADGSRVGGEFLVNTAVAGNQATIQLAALAGGSFAATWVDGSAGVGGARGDASSTAIKAQIFGTGNVGGTYSLTEGEVLDLKGHFSVQDVDSPGVVTVTVGVAAGAIVAGAGGSGVTLAGSGTATLTVTGTVGVINAFFASDATSTIAYNATSPSPPPEVALTLTINDGTLSSSAIQKLFVADIPYAPESQDATISGAEDSRITFATSHFAYSDPDGVGNLAGVVITTLPVLGTLFLDADGPGGSPPIAVTAGQFVTVADITAGRLSFVPEPNGNGNGYASFTFQVRDFAATLNQDPTPNTLTIDVTPVSDPYAVSGFTSGKVIGEDAAHSGVIIDTGISFVDIDGQFAGGRLTVTGLLAEDRISVLDQGDGAGQLGVSGATLSYGGVAIGTIAGGVGNAFTINFNAASTNAAVEAVVEHLTYSNVSDTPTASRQLVLNLVDESGFQLARPTFAEASGAANPLNGINVGQGASFAFIDIDGDGDKDILAGGSAQYKVRAFLNNGPGNAFTELTGSANPMNAVNFVQAIKVGAGDVDGDGDLDLAVGLGSGTFGNSGQINVYINRGPGLSWIPGSTFAGVDLGTDSTPTFADFDNDGDMDMVSGAQGGFLYAFRNNGPGVFNQLTGTANPFDGIRVHNNQNTGAPAFMDLDGDGDQDLIVGSTDGWLVAYRNNGAGQAFTEFLPNAVGNVESVLRGLGRTTVRPSTGDVDGDGDIDLIVSSFSAGLPLVFLNTPDVGAAFDIVVRASNDAPTLSGLAASVTFAENVVNGSPQRIDFDVDFADAEGNFAGGRLTVSGLLAEDRVGVHSLGMGAGEFTVSGADLWYGFVVIGTLAGGAGTTLTITFNSEATSGAVDALLQRLAYGNASHTPTADRTLTIEIVDGAGAGPLRAPVFTQASGWDNPTNNSVWELNGANLVGPEPRDVVIRFADLNDDALPDALVGTAEGTLKLFSGLMRWDGVFFITNDLPFNAFAGIDVGTNAAPALVDLDGDGHLDALVGNGAGELLAFTSSGPGTAFALMAANPFAGIDVGDRAAPGFGDLDGDGDLDALVGNADGALLAFRNNGPGTAFTALTGTDNPFDGIDVGDNAIPDFVDLDGDGDKDALVGTADGHILAFRNNGAGHAFTELTGADNPFAGRDVGSNAAPGVVDLDGDDSPDLVVGDSDSFPSAFRSSRTGTSINVNVTANPDRPVVSATAVEPVFVENGAAVALGAGITVTHPEGLALVRAMVTITSGADAEDVLAFVNDDAGSFGNIAASYDADAHQLELVSADGTATLAQFAAALRAATFANGSDDPTSTRELSIEVVDAQGVFSDAVTRTVNITAVNDAPVNTLPANFSGTEGVALAITGLSVSDVDDHGAVIQVGLSVTRGVLTIRTDVSGGLTAGNVVNNGSDMVVILASRDEINTTLAEMDGLVFHGSNVSGNVTLAMTTDDLGNTGTGGDQSDTDLSTLTLAPVADTAGVSDATTDEDTMSSGGLVIIRNPVDGAEVTHFKITGIANGTLYLFDGVTRVNNGDFISFADANAGLKFDPTPNSFGRGSFDVQASLTDSDAGLGGVFVTATVTVNSINDAPVVPDQGDIATFEQRTTGLFPAITISDVDLDAFNGGLGDYAGATFAIGRGTPSPDDFFSVDTRDALFTVNAVNGSDLEAGGLVFATIVQSGGGAWISFTSLETEATTALVNDVLRHLTYTNVSDNPPDTLTLVYGIDDGSTGGGQGNVIGGNNVAGQDIVVTFTKSNDAPLLLNLAADSVAYTEGDSPVRLDHGNNAFVSDPDNTDFDGGRLTVLIDGTGNDALVWNSPVVDVDGMTGGVSVSGVSIGFASPVVVGAQFGLQIDLNAAATPAIVDQLIRGIAFTNHGDSPTEGTRTVTWTLNDGRGADAVITSSVVITPVNDTPWLTPTGPVASIEQVPTAILAGVTVTDLELDAKNHFLGDYAGATFFVDRAFSPNAEDLFSLVAGAGFTIDGNRLEAGGLAFATFSVDPTGYILIEFTSSETPATSALADAVIQSIRYANGSDTPPPSVDIGYQFHDGWPGGGQGGGGFGQAFEMVRVNLTAVNDAPVNGLTPTQAGTEDTNVIFSVAGGNAITVSDAEATTLEVTISVAHGVLTLADTTDLVFTAGTGTGDATMSFSGTAAAINRALDGLIYAPEADYAGDDTLTITTGDGSEEASDSVVIALASVNEAPLLGNLEGNSGSFTEDGAPVLLDAGSNATVWDNDSPDFGGGSLTVSVVAGGVAGEDLLGIDTGGPVTVAGNIVSVGATAIGTITSDGSNGNDLVIAFNADATLLLVQELVRALTYANADVGDPDTTPRSIEIALVDGDGVANAGLDSVLVTVGATIMATDDPAVAADDAVTTLENQIATGSLFDNDDHPDGPLAVARVNGSTGHVGTTITLASGARLTVQANGNYSYDPSDRFSYLISPTKAAATGAFNGTTTDSFTYQLLTGNMATVTFTITGVNSADDELRGNSVDNIITGTIDGDVFVLTQGGDDEAHGGFGNDIFIAGLGDDLLDGGIGSDTVSYAHITGEVRVNLLLEGPQVRRAAGADALESIENVIGGFGDDSIWGTNGANRLEGGAGNDRLFGRRGNDVLVGGFGDDLIDGGDGSDTVSYAGATGEVRVNLLLEGPQVRRATGSDTLVSIENVITGAGNDSIWGTNGANRLEGGDGNDRLFGRRGNDVLIGGSGNDQLDGSFDNDLMEGEIGADQFIFEATLSATDNVDHILDFAVGQDRIVLENAIFTGLAAGKLPDGAFKVGTAATDLDDRIIYNSTTGALLFDADGSNAGAAVQFAVLDNPPASLSASDFLVI